MMAPLRSALLSRMEAARHETCRHLELVHRQIETRAERATITEKAKSRSHKRSGARWTRSDEFLFRQHVNRLLFERRHEIDALSRKLTRQDRALDAFRADHRFGLSEVD